MTTTRPPLRNLGPMSEEWGRWIDGVALQHETAIESLGGDGTNDGRINNSTLDSLAGQIGELFNRQATVLSAPDMITAAFNESAGTQTVSVSMQIPRPTDASRLGWVTVSARPGVSPALTTGIFATFSIDGRVFHRTSASMPIQTSIPAGWDAFSFAGATGFTATPTSGGLVTVTLEAVPEAFGDTGFRQAFLTGITATAAYAQMV